MRNKDKKTSGRPTNFKNDYIHLVYNLCLLGHTDAEIAKVFNVSEVTFNAWKKKYPEFLKSIKKGKDIADGEVVNALRQRALGYSHKEDKIFHNPGAPKGEKKVTTVETIKHYPPDTAAAIFWLKNRKQVSWKDKQEIDVKSPAPLGYQFILQVKKEDINDNIQQKVSEKPE